MNNSPAHKDHKLTPVPKSGAHRPEELLTVLHVFRVQTPGRHAQQGAQDLGFGRPSVAREIGLDLDGLDPLPSVPYQQLGLVLKEPLIWMVKVRTLIR